MKVTLILSFLTLNLLFWHSLTFGQTYNAGTGSGSGGTNNVHVGSYAGRISTGFQNNFIGSHSGYSNTSGDNNIFIGHAAGLSNTTGYSNSFIGSYCGSYNSTGNYNSFLGFYAGYFNSTGNYNSFIGSLAGYRNTTGEKNSFLGVDAGYSNTTGAYNTINGFQAGFANSAGVNNTLIGALAGNATASSNNTFIGKGAGEKNTVGGINTFVGSEAGLNNINGYHNVFIGRSTALKNTSGYENTFLGNSAGSANTVGNKSTALGYLAGPSVNNLTNTTAVGHRARVSISNALVLGSINGVNGATADTKVGIRTTAPAYNLHVNGTAGKPGGGSWTAPSDKRLKQNIKDFKEGLSTLEKIRPVTFQYNGIAGLPTEKEYVGVIAQEMQQIAPYMVGEFIFQDSSGMQENYLDYDATALMYILVNAAKEQQQFLKQKDQEVAQLQQENQEIRQELAAIKALLTKQIPETGNPQARLWQNNPNPYTQSTTIKYQIPLTAETAYIKVYSSTGQEVKSFDLTGKTKGEVILSAGMFSAGSYVYTFFVDGVSVDSKKLVLTR